MVQGQNKIKLLSKSEWQLYHNNDDIIYTKNNQLTVISIIILQYPQRDFLVLYAYIVTTRTCQMNLTDETQFTST